MTNNTFESHPHQRHITVHRENLDPPFLQISKESFEAAYKKLKGNGLCLFLYLICNQNGYQFWLSPQAIENNLGMNYRTVQRQIERMIKNGYLVRRGEDSNEYDLYEVVGEDGAFEEAAEDNTEQTEESANSVTTSKGLVVNGERYIF